MKRCGIMVFMAFTAFNVKSQKLEKPIIDKITGDTIFATKEQALSNKFKLIGHYLACNIIKLNNFYLLYFHAKDGLSMNYHVLTGDKAFIKFSDGKFFKIAAFTDMHSSIVPHAKPPVTQGFFSYNLTDQAVTRLLGGKISTIRIMTSLGPFDYEISEGKSEIIKKQLELLKKPKS